MGTRIINLTPHNLVIRVEDEEITITPEPGVDLPRVGMVYGSHPPINGIEVATSHPGNVSGLPDRRDNTVYVVSAMVAQSIKNRNDVFAPDTGRTAIRDDDGQIVAVTRLLRYM